MKVFVGGHLINMSSLDVIGPGGEGLVVKAKINGNKTVALKVYHEKLQTIARARKLKAFFAQKWTLPTNRIAVPIEPAYNEDKSLIIGLIMPYLGTGFDDIAQLSNKNIRLSYGINTKNVAQIFLDGLGTLEQIHSNGLVVGDLSDRNVLFRGTEMLWIDVDSWQFGNFPCPVATEEYVDPNLYGVDLPNAPAFKPENDWYSFAVLFFRSLLMVHPYGGVHKTVKELKRRAKSRITVFDKDVKYPKIAFSPDILSDDLAQEFDKIFRTGVRETFPKSLVQNYLNDLTECSNCHSWYPRNRKGCPVCNKRTVVIIARKVIANKGVRSFEFFKTSGDIVYTKVSNNKIFVVTHENGKAKLHTIDQNGNVSEKHLSDTSEGARYTMTEEILSVNYGHSQEIILHDVTSKSVRQIKQTVTELYEPNRRAVFQATQNKVLRMIGGNILSIEKGGMGIIERSIRTGVPNQTWFSANDSYNGMQLFGLIQILHEKRFWYHLDGQNFEPSIPNLEIDEVLLDISVKFSHGEVLLRRKSQQNGVDFLRQEIVNDNGEVTYSSRIRYGDYPVQGMHGQIYSNGILLHATDDGIVQEKVTSQEFKTFKQTMPFVGEGDILHKFNKGIVVVDSNSITYLELR